MELKKSDTGNKFDVMMSNFLKNAGNAIFLGLFLTISVGCSTYVYFFENVTVDIQLVIGGVALMFSLLFAAMGRLTFHITEKTQATTIKKMYWWLGCINLIVFVIYTIKLGNYPAGWMLKITVLIIMGGLNQAILRYGQYDTINNHKLIIVEENDVAA